jgi:Flp pilus assembly protein TadG
MRATLRSLVRETSGSAAIEFAVVGNVFLMFVIAIAYAAIILWHEAHLDWAVQRSSRLAALGGTTVTATDIQTAVNGYLTSVGMNPATVQYQVSTLGGAKVGQITASMTETFSVPLFKPLHLTYTASADVPQPDS